MVVAGHTCGSLVHTYSWPRAGVFCPSCGARGKDSAGHSRHDMPARCRPHIDAGKRRALPAFANRFRIVRAGEARRAATVPSTLAAPDASPRGATLPPDPTFAARVGEAHS